jgi:hypothetical protein
LGAPFFLRIVCPWGTHTRASIVEHAISEPTTIQRYRPADCQSYSVAAESCSHMSTPTRACGYHLAPGNIMFVCRRLLRITSQSDGPLIPTASAVMFLVSLAHTSCCTWAASDAVLFASRLQSAIHGGASAPCGILAHCIGFIIWVVDCMSSC